MRDINPLSEYINKYSFSEDGQVEQKLKRENTVKITTE